MTPSSRVGVDDPTYRAPVSTTISDKAIRPSPLLSEKWYGCAQVLVSGYPVTAPVAPIPAYWLGVSALLRKALKTTATFARTNALSNSWALEEISVPSVIHT